MLISYYMVYMLACFKFRADRLSSLSKAHKYKKIMSQFVKASVLSDISFETKSMWTFIDYLRLYSYCHLLDLVLALILITGTLEYDILHLGYLGFAMVFFRMRLEILKKKNKIFKFLRMYNFALIVLSLAYQSPLVRDFSKEKCAMIDYISEVIGFYKFDYGFRITSRSALVEIIIFMLVSLQSYMFSSQEFDYVSKYLEAEQIGAIVREQEKRAAWKTAQLLLIRKSEEQKHHRNLQVEKMKSEMLNLQIQLQSMSTNSNYGNTSPKNEGLRRRWNSSLDSQKVDDTPEKRENEFKKEGTDSFVQFDMIESPKSVRPGSPAAAESRKPSGDSLPEIIEVKERTTNHNFWHSDERDKEKSHGKENPIISAVHLIGDGVSQVQSLGNLAVNNLVSFLNIDHVKPESNDPSSEDGMSDKVENQNMGSKHFDRTFSTHSGTEGTVSDSAFLQLGMIFSYVWAQIRSNNDIVCYCCFILMFLWNFSLISMVYLAALFLYALCVTTGPGFIFWTIMLIYTEICILLQYLYQIIIQHSGLSIHLSLLQELGFPSHKIVSSFVINNLTLFLVYFFTLLQTSIIAKEGEWAVVTEFSFLKRRNLHQKENIVSSNFRNRMQKSIVPIKDAMKLMLRSLHRYWKSVTRGAESPPYFLQLSMEVNLWPEDGIQPERIESGINKLLNIVCERRCKKKNLNYFHLASRVRVQSIERSPENPNIALAVFEVVYASPSKEFTPVERYQSLTPAADVANEILEAQLDGNFEETRFPYPILSVIGGGKREIDLYAYIFCADLSVFFLVAIFYQSVIKSNSEFLEVYQLEDQFPKEFVFILMVSLSLLIHLS